MTFIFTRSETLAALQIAADPKKPTSFWTKSLAKDILILAVSSDAAPSYSLRNIRYWD